MILSFFVLFFSVSIFFLLISVLVLSVFCLFFGGGGKAGTGGGGGQRSVVLFTVLFLCISFRNTSMLKPGPTDCVLRSQFTRVYTCTTLRGQDWHVVTFDFRGKTNVHFTSR